ncbi:MAG: S-methyl-5-thioribose-1-phosphate isomerase [Chloroflexi bacterium]|nr:S-methyl-5-thioribose-1-phosphate isomerase [Chloroflexota bacterium]
MVTEETVKVIEWLGDRVRLIDQTRLPQAEVYLDLTDYHDVAAAIKELKIRGAPAIGVAGAYALALGALHVKAATRKEFLKEFEKIKQAIASTRPTARNLFWSLERLAQVAQTSSEDVARTKEALVNEALRIHAEEAEATLKLSEFGAALLKDSSAILTHCNTGALATAGYGTALGVIKWAIKQGKHIRVLATETRPLLQGARLTCWELKKADIPATLITDSMAGYLMSLGKIDGVIVGADRIAANGDTANKIGTYTLAVLAKAHNIPFYIAAPTSTIDLSLASGKGIPIEERRPEEVTGFQGVTTAPADMAVANPAFDVTPHHLITAIITEKGVVGEPYGEGIKEICHVQAG